MADEVVKAVEALSFRFTTFESKATDKLDKIVVVLEKIAQLEKQRSQDSKKIDDIDDRVVTLQSNQDKATGAISFLKWLIGVSGGCVFSFIIWLASQTIATQVWIAKTDEWKITITEKIK